MDDQQIWIMLADLFWPVTLTWITCLIPFTGWWAVLIAVFGGMFTTFLIVAVCDAVYTIRKELADKRVWREQMEAIWRSR